MSEKYKFSNQVLKDQGIKGKKGDTIKVEMGELKVKGKITKIVGDDVFLETD